MKKKFRVTKGWFSELSTTESTFHFNDERIKFVKWSTFLFHSNVIRATNSCIFLIVDIRLHWLYDLIISSQLFHQIFLTLNELLQEMQLSQYLKKIGECVSIPVITPYNSVPGQWSHCLDFLTFIFWQFGHRRLSPPVILVSGVNLIAWFCLCAQDSKWMNHILHIICTCQSDKNIPRSQADWSCILWFIQAKTFHVWFLNDFQFLSRSRAHPESNKNVSMLLFSLEHHLFAARKNLIEQSQFFAPASIFSSILSKHKKSEIANAMEMPVSNGCRRSSSQTGLCFLYFLLTLL